MAGKHRRMACKSARLTEHLIWINRLVSRASGRSQWSTRHRRRYPVNSIYLSWKPFDVSVCVCLRGAYCDTLIFACHALIDTKPSSISQPIECNFHRAAVPSFQRWETNVSAINNCMAFTRRILAWAYNSLESIVLAMNSRKILRKKRTWCRIPAILKHISTHPQYMAICGCGSRSEFICIVHARATAIVIDTYR